MASRWVRKPFADGTRIQTIDPGRCPGYSFVAQIYKQANDVPWTVKSHYAGEHGAREQEYAFGGVEDPWSSDRVIYDSSLGKRRTILIGAIVAALLVTMISGALVFFSQKRKAEEERDRALQQRMEQMKKAPANP